MYLRALGVFLLVTGIAAAAPAAKPTDKEAQKTIKTVLTAIRYDKNDLAAKQLAWGPMSKAFLGDYWKKLSGDEQKEVTAGIETLIRKISFTKGRDLFEHLDAVLYAPVEMEEDKALVKTTVVVHRQYKKTEIVIDFVLVEEGGQWKIMDTVMAGESTTEGFYEDQVEPLFEEGGSAALMKALREKLADLK